MSTMDEQKRVYAKMQTLSAAQDWMGMSEVEGEALEVVEKVRAEQPEFAVVIFTNLGNCFYKISRYDKAIHLLTQAHAAAAELGDKVGVERACTNLGACFRDVGEYAKAAELFEAARASAEEGGRRSGVGTACNNLGLCYRLQGQIEKAIALHEEARSIAAAEGHRLGVGEACSNLALCYQSIGQHSRAIELILEDHAIAKEVGDWVGVGLASGNLGNSFMSIGQYDSAIAMLEEARGVLEEVGDRAGVGRACNNLGLCHQHLGQLSTAMSLHEEALAIAEAVGNRAGVAAASQNLGICHRSLGQHGQAIELLKRARAIEEELGNPAGVGRACGNIALAYQGLGEYDEALQLLEQEREIAAALGDKAGVGSASVHLASCYTAKGLYDQAVKLLEEALPIAEEVGDLAGVGVACNNLGVALDLNGDAEMAAHVLARGLAALELIERGVGADDHRRVSLFEEQQKTYANLQLVLLGKGQRESEANQSLPSQGACGPGDDAAVGSRSAQWALGVASQAKARALAHRLGSDQSSRGEQSWRGAAFTTSDCSRDEDEAFQEARPIKGRDPTHQEESRGSRRLSSSVSLQRALDEALAQPPPQHAGPVDRLHESVCQKWWEEVELLARQEGGGTRIVEYSLLWPDDRAAMLAIWVMTGDGLLLCSATVCGVTASGHTAQELLVAAREAMHVRGRDALADHGVPAEESLAEEAARLRELYELLIAPVEQHLAGADELLIIPHQELFETPWAALMDGRGRYLIEHHVLRVAPSLRVARQAADSMAGNALTPGHVVVVGNPLPLPDGFRPLPFAQKEAEKVEDILNRAGVIVGQEHFFKADRNPKASKAVVMQALQGAGWAHVACHGDMDTDSLVLATQAGGENAAAKTEEQNGRHQGDRPAAGGQSDEDAATRIEEQKPQDADLASSTGQTGRAKPTVAGRADRAATKRAVPRSALFSNLSMREVQASVRLARGATVALSACNTGRGEIKAEGVVGLARGFLVAGAAATVVSLWSIDDGSTAMLMGLMYSHLVQGVTVPQALRLAMLRLAARSEHVAPGSKPQWARPMHWAGFLVVGASTRLPLGLAGKTAAVSGAGDHSDGASQPHLKSGWQERTVDEVCELVRQIGLAEAAVVLHENRVDGKTMCSAEFDRFFTMDLCDGGLGLTLAQKARLQAEMSKSNQCATSVLR